MTAQFSIVTTLVLIAMTAGGYAIATLGMKLASSQISTLAVSLMTAGLVAAALAEINLLRHTNLAVIYLGIIAVETLLVLSIAAMIGDRLTPQQMSGGALVLLGLALVSH